MIQAGVEAALHELALERVVTPALEIASFLVPVLVIYGLARWRSTQADAAHTMLRAVVSLAVVIAGVGAGGWSMIHGAHARGRARAQLALAYGRPVVSAIEQYHADHRAFPARLDDLVPQYLSADALRAPERSPLGCPVKYQPHQSYYLVSLRAGGAAGPRCEFSSATGRWYCAGML